MNVCNNPCLIYEVFGYDQGGVMMNKTSISVVFMMFLFLCAASNSTSVYAEDMIHYQVIGGNTLVISGTGEVNSVLGFDKNIDRSQIKKLIIGEGITKISASRTELLHLERIILPNTLVEIGNGAFSCNEHLKEIVFGNSLKKVGVHAFSGCEDLQQIVLPDTVTEIGMCAFAECPQLKKIVLPKSLSNWDISVAKYCPALREIVNRSQISCKIPWYKKYVTWKVGEKETRVIPPGKTGKSVGKTIPIKFHLMGGNAVGKLPKSYRFGEEVKLPECVKRKGYVFMGWCTSMYDSIQKIEIGQKKAEFYATWYKYKVESKKSGTATVTFDSTEAVLSFWDQAIRYSTNKNMKDWDIVYCPKKKGKMTIRNLWPGRTYYFQICGKIDGDLPYRNWRAKRKVSICR